MHDDRRRTRALRPAGLDATVRLARPEESDLLARLARDSGAPEPRDAWCFELALRLDVERIAIVLCERREAGYLRFGRSHDGTALRLRDARLVPRHDTHLALVGALASLARATGAEVLETAPGCPVRLRRALWALRSSIGRLVPR